VDVEGEGSVTIDPVEDTYHYGDVATLSAAADPGWSFFGWSGDASGTRNPLLFTMTGNAIVTANFTQNEYTLDVVVDPADTGSVLIEPLQASYHYGDQVTLTPSANPGWSFANWSGDVTGTDNPLIFTIMGNTTIAANYEQTLLTIFLPLIVK
jgi:uncharacterized repeat protein (TIGR02543 family)